MESIIKWAGGKRKEIGILEPYFPKFNKYVEPFVGGGAVFFHLNHKNSIISDYDYDLINFYRQYAIHSDFFISELNRIGSYSQIDLKEEYYKQRVMDRNGLLELASDDQKAIRFYIINQLSYHGLKRTNKRGELNVPIDLKNSKNGLNTTKITNNKESIDLLRSSIILNSDFQKVIEDNDEEDTFIFLDPPYVSEFKEYTAGNNFDINEQKRLQQCFFNIKNAKCLIVINSCSETEELYKDNIKYIYSLNYNINIVNRNDRKASHLIITNY